MKKYYAKIGQKSEHITKFFTLDRLQKVDWVEFPGFMGTLVMPEIMSKEPFCAAVEDKWPGSVGIIMRLDPHVAYLWHRDVDRSFTINMLLHDNSHSHTVFGQRRTEFNSDIHELKYDLGHFYIFNTQEEHEVYNFDEYRYLFTMKVPTDEDYSSVVEWAGENGWLF